MLLEKPRYRPKICVKADHTGSVRVTVLRDKKADGTAQADNFGEYFAFGAEVADRSTISSFGKRYGYQGEWAEKDRNVTDMTEFDLRHYDADLGRWMVPDPYEQYHSPYLAMGNDPVNSIDPDGGFSVPGALIGAGVGFAVGAAVGLATDKDNWGYYAAGGALIGGVAGGFIGGSSMDGSGLHTSGEATGWQKVRSGFGEGRIAGSGKYVYGGKAVSYTYFDDAVNFNFTMRLVESGTQSIGGVSYAVFKGSRSVSGLPKTIGSYEFDERGNYDVMGNITNNKLNVRLDPKSGYVNSNADLKKQNPDNWNEPIGSGIPMEVQVNVNLGDQRMVTIRKGFLGLNKKTHAAVNKKAKLGKHKFTSKGATFPR